MSIRPGNLLYICLLLFYTFMFACIHGKDEDALSTCEVALMVPKGTTWRVAPHHELTVRCPVLNCGESVRVTWCKQLDRCEPVFTTENVEMIQSDESDGKLMAYLIFKRITVQDAGLYRCYIDNYKTEQISHIINISVSALNHGIENPDDSHSDHIPDPAVDADISWLPFFFVCLGIVLSVGIVIMLPLFRRYCQKRTLTFNQTNTQETTTLTIPDLPTRSPPSNFLQQHQPLFPSDILSPNVTGMLTSRPNMMTEATQPPNGVLYARIKHGQSGMAAVTGPHADAAQRINALYEGAYYC